MMRRLISCAIGLIAASCAQAQVRLRPAEVDALPSTAPVAVMPYGTTPLQFGELRLPKGRGPFPVAVVIHGGCWTKGLATLRNTAPMASALTDQGFATWNIEYRQVGDEGGGWPGTFLDWGLATDHLRSLAKSYPIDLSRVTVIGHSAGAHAALFLAARRKLARNSEVRGDHPLRLTSAVAVDGPGDLDAFANRKEPACRRGVIERLMGGTSEQVPARYKQGSPVLNLPLGVPQYLISGSPVWPAEEAEHYRKQAIAAGDKVRLLKLESGHFNLIAPGQPEWTAVLDFIKGDVVHKRP